MIKTYISVGFSADHGLRKELAAPSSPAGTSNLFLIEEGKLERRILNIGSTKHVAISHIWGDAEWQEIQVLRLDREVLVSKEKARFISRLHSIVGLGFSGQILLCGTGLYCIPQYAYLAHLVGCGDC